MPPHQFVPAEEVTTTAPLIIALSGMSGSGKTYSALLMAKQIAEARGGPVCGICSEAGRMAKYKDPRHYPELTPYLIRTIDPPHHSDKYRDAILDADKGGAGAIITDSFTDEWEGDGGVLSRQEAALERMTGGDTGKRDKMSPRAWAEAKSTHTKLHNSMFGVKAPLIVCYRARPKTGFVKGKFIDIGVQPVCDHRMIYDFTFHLLMSEEKQDGSYTVLKGGYKHERGVFPKDGKIDNDAISRLLETMELSPVQAHEETVEDVWEMREDHRYVCTNGKPDDSESRRNLFRLLKRDFSENEKDAAMEIFEANKHHVRSMPQQAKTKLYELIAALEEQP